jgi:hypothetical protein
LARGPRKLWPQWRHGGRPRNKRREMSERWRGQNGGLSNRIDRCGPAGASVFANCTGSVHAVPQTMLARPQT